METQEAVKVDDQKEILCAACLGELLEQLHRLM